MLGTEPQALCVLGKHTTNGSTSQPCAFVLQLHSTSSAVWKRGEENTFTFLFSNAGLQDVTLFAAIRRTQKHTAQASIVVSS